MTQSRADNKRGTAASLRHFGSAAWCHCPAAKRPSVEFVESYRLTPSSIDVTARKCVCQQQFSRSAPHDAIGPVSDNQRLMRRWANTDAASDCNHNRSLIRTATLTVPPRGGHWPSAPVRRQLFGGATSRVRGKVPGNGMQMDSIVATAINFCSQITIIKPANERGNV